MDKHLLTIAIAKHLGRGDFSLSGSDADGYILHFSDGTTTQGSNYDLASIYAAEDALRNKRRRIAELKRLLRDTDYVTLSDYDKDKAEIITQRAAWRAEVRELEAAHLAAQAQNGV